MLAGLQKLSPRTMWIYGAPSFAGAAMVIPIAIHMTKFYADTVLVPLGYLGVAIALARAFDAITDPAMGWLSDRTRSRWGRRRPWIAVGAPLCAVAFWLLFHPPPTLSPLGGAAWFLLAYTLYFLFHTVYLVPYVALGAELTLDYHERSSLFALREGLVITGTLCAAAAPWLLTERLGGERAAFHVFSTIFALLLAGLYLNVALRLRERADYSRQPVNPLVPGVRRSLRNPPFRVLLAVAVLAGVPGGLSATLMPFFSEYVIQPENPDALLGMLLLGYFGSALLTLPVWLRVAQRVGKRNAQLASLALGAVSSAGIIFVGPGDTLYIGICIVGAGAGFGSISFLLTAMKADVIDYDELHTGRRREAQYSSFWMIVPKYVQIPSAAIPIALLGAMGYVANQEQTPQVIAALRGMFSVVPALCFGLGFVVLLRYPVSAEVHRGIRAGIEAHGRGEAALDPLTGKWLPPPGGGDVDGDTSWFLDYFSAGELERTLRGERVLPGIRMRAGVAAGVAVAGAWVTWRGVSDPGREPGLLPVLAVVVAGVALALVLFHLARLPAARRLERSGVDAGSIRAHLAQGLGARDQALPAPPAPRPGEAP
jgi:GPH family glycoside/pentoside/hexuronide:cation symporter